MEFPNAKFLLNRVLSSIGKKEGLSNGKKKIPDLKYTLYCLLKNDISAVPEEGYALGKLDRGEAELLEGIMIEKGTLALLHRKQD